MAKPKPLTFRQLRDLIEGLSFDDMERTAWIAPNTGGPEYDTDYVVVGLALDDTDSPVLLYSDWESRLAGGGGN